MFGTVAAVQVASELVEVKIEFKPAATNLFPSADEVTAYQLALAQW